MVAVVLLAAAAASAQQAAPGVQAGAGSPKELVRRAVENDIRGEEQNKTHWRYRQEKQTSAGFITRDVVETKQGSVSKLIAVDGRQPTQAELAKDEQERQRFISSVEEQEKKRKASREDAQNVERMMRGLPEAFLYEQAGTEKTPQGEVVHLKFKPNPNYDPPTRELRVYAAMTGDMWINTTEWHIAKMDGTLMQDVNFGWGILGHLNRGGKFMVVNANVGEGHWDTLTLDVNFAGKALFFKTIDMKEKERNSHFQRVRDDLTLAQAAELLKQNGDVVAKK